MNSTDSSQNKYKQITNEDNMKKCSQHTQPSAIETETETENYAEIPSYSG